MRRYTARNRFRPHIKTSPAKPDRAPFLSDKRDAALKSQPKLWVYNYNFEFELLKRSPATVNNSRFSPWFFLNRSALLQAPLAAPQDLIAAYRIPPDVILEELSAKLGRRPRFVKINPVRGESNSIFHDMATDREFLSRIVGFRLAPWGWCPRAMEFSHKYLKNSAHPAEDIVPRLNSKQYSHFLRDKFLGPEFSIPSLDVTAEALSDAPLKARLDGFHRKHPDFYVKHYLGAAGKLTDRYRENPSSNKIRKWQAWIKEAGGLLLEKKMPVKRERSIQAEVSRDKSFVPIVFTELISSSSNSYLGNIVNDYGRAIPEKLWKEMRPIRKIIAESGYRGPLGIDLIETEDGALKLLEINARLTMGRIAFEWHKAVNPFPAGLFFNMFVKNSPFSDYEEIYREFKRPEKERDCSISVVNLAADKNKNFSATLLIGAESANKLWEIFERVRRVKKRGL